MLSASPLMPSKLLYEVILEDLQGAIVTRFVQEAGREVWVPLTCIIIIRGVDASIW